MNLSLDKKSLGCAAVGFLLIGGLLFLAGFLLATRLYQPSESTSESSAAERGQQRFAPPRALRPRFRMPRPPSLTPVRQAQSIANRAAAGSGAGATGKVAASAQPSTVEPPSEAGVAAGPGAQDSAPVEPVVYSVQVGAFLRDSDVDLLLRDLEDLGFMPFVIKDSEGRLLSVRIGKFDTREAAELLAEEFKAQTGRNAVVRPPLPR